MPKISVDCESVLQFLTGLQQKRLSVEAKHRQLFAAQIAAAGAVVTIHDPKAIAPAKKRFPALGFSEDIEGALKGADLVLHLTEWKVYRELDPAKMAKLVANPIIIDGRNALDREAWIAAGWKFRALGRAN